MSNHWQSTGIEFVFRSGKTRTKTSLLVMQRLKQCFVKEKREENQTSRDVATTKDMISTRGQIISTMIEENFKSNFNTFHCKERQICMKLMKILLFLAFTETEWKMNAHVMNNFPAAQKLLSH